MTHGDDAGLILPPRLAPIQTVIVPIYKHEDEKTAVMEAVAAIEREVVDLGVRTKVDMRDHLTPGYKFNDWELRGVPVRIEVGPRDVQNGSVLMARRDQRGKEGKRAVARSSIGSELPGLLKGIQAALLQKAANFREANTRSVTNYAEFKEAIECGFARAAWAGSSDDEVRVKEETRATLRCIPFVQPLQPGRCFLTGKPAERIAIFGRAY
jgi:prolyl-tRNA synthetase